MATIFEFFGFPALDASSIAVEHRAGQKCPFLGDTCEKTLNDGTVAGVCTLLPARSGPVVCCPVRLYADDYRVLRDVADLAFRRGLELVDGPSARSRAKLEQRDVVAVFGRRWGGELRLPQRSGTGSYFVDWILALIDPTGKLVEFVAIEVQSIDTTGNYRNGRTALLNSQGLVQTTAGFNWENVSKRILPQVIYKGNVLQRESKCRKGLFFVTPAPVYEKIMKRLGGQSGLLRYPMQSSSITFISYEINCQVEPKEGSSYPLNRDSIFTTNIGQVAQAFAGPGVMPPQDCYRDAILDAL